MRSTFSVLTAVTFLLSGWGKADADPDSVPEKEESTEDPYFKSSICSFSMFIRDMNGSPVYGLSLVYIEETSEESREKISDFLGQIEWLNNNWLIWIEEKV